MAKITIDGESHEINPDNNLLQECLSLGLDLPYFCWHPCMGSVGACRQCAVKQYRNAEDKNGTLVMACMTPAADGSIISVNDPQARAFRANVIESLMISHPHDCPVCEEGGECHLQDMTLMSGHNYRRYDRDKVTYNNQYLGPFIGHEMNRCISCYRCVRFYDDYAGGTDLSAQASHHHVYFGRQQDGCLESEFSGNLVEVCPTGVFTDATFSAHYARKWDLQSAPSVCTGCAVGCNTTPGERYGSLRRIVNRYHPDVNGYFLCDRGRFGYGFVNSEKRLSHSFARMNGEARKLEPRAAEQQLAAAFGPRTIGIGSPRAGNEANFALMQRVGRDNFYAGMDATDLAAVATAIRMADTAGIQIPDIRTMEEADAVLIVGEDLTNTAPRIALALRQTARNRALELAAAARIPLWQDAAVRELAQDEKTPIYLLSGYGTRLDDVAATVHVDAEPGLLRIAAAVAHGVDDRAPAATSKLDDDEAELVNTLVGVLRRSARPLIITGSAAGSTALIHAAANIALSLARVRDGGAPVGFCSVTPEVNSMGLGMMLKDSGNGLDRALQKMAAGEVDKVIVLENDLYRRAPRRLLEQSLGAIKQLIAIDQLPTATTDAAQLVIASTSFAEQEASYVNYEGRAQLSYQVYRCASDARAAWTWLRSADNPAHFEDLLRALADSVPVFSRLPSLLPDRAHYPNGLKVPRQPHRYSGRTAMNADVAVNEPRQAVDSESILNFSMEGASQLKDAYVLGAAWAPQWNSNQSISKFQAEVGGELRQTSGEVSLWVAPGTRPGEYREVQGGDANGKGLQAIRAQQIFGSDELTAMAAPIQSRMSGNYVALSAKDARHLSLHHGQRVRVSGAAAQLDAALIIRRKVRAGTAVVYCEQEPSVWYGLQGTLTIDAGRSDQPQSGLHNLIITDLLQEGE